MPDLSSFAPATAANQVIGNAPFEAATSTPETATIADTATHLIGPFTPQLNRPVWLLLNATVAASGTAQVLRSIDGGATKPGLTNGPNARGSYNFADVIGVIAQEAIATETSALATWWLAITLTAGAVTANLHQ